MLNNYYVNVKDTQQTNIYFYVSHVLAFLSNTLNSERKVNSECIPNMVQSRVVTRTDLSDMIPERDDSEILD